MNAWIVHTAQSAACTVLLLTAYRLLLHGRVSFRTCRYALLGTLAVSLIIPLLRIPVWPTAQPAAAAAVISETPYLYGALPSPAPFLPGTLAFAIYIGGTLVVLSSMFIQLGRIRRLRRTARIGWENGLRIVETAQPIGSFSLFGTIYLRSGLSAAERRMIVTHEASHVRHRHSRERLLMESLKALSWWNPAAWIATRWLSEVQEFEADRDVLASGFARTDYCLLLLRHLCNVSPRMASGLHNSFTFKRFSMMISTKKSSRHALLRTIGMCSATALLTLAFGTTTQARRLAQGPTGTGDSIERLQSTVEVLPFSDEDPAYLMLPEARYYIDDVPVDKTAVKDLNRSDIISMLISDAQDEVRITTRNAPNSSGMQTRPGFSSMIRKPRLPEHALILIDGKEATREELSNIPEDRIVEINVVKDKSMIEKYGEKAGEGVVFITTENASDGQYGIYSHPETMPSFQGSDITTFRQWLMSKIHYPEEAIAKGKSGKVFAEFVIEKDGKISGIRILKSPDESLSAEVKRILSTSPRWTPGRQNGKPVAVKYTLPIQFSVQPETASAATGQ